MYQVLLFKSRRHLCKGSIEPMTFKRLQKIKNSELLKYRLKEEQRLKKLSDKTVLR